MRTYSLSSIRNFSIIAHIDHGKSTLADRLLEHTQTVSAREMKEQFLDDMELEREKGITIKARPVSMIFSSKEGGSYQFNLIDTPGHVDFSYEVSRSLSACEGALLVVDATQGVQAQTLANVLLALEKNLEIIPVINKIDMASADIEGTKQQIKEVIGMDASQAICISAKAGIGIQELCEAIVQRIPPPKEEENESLKALVFDSRYDPYRGALIYTRIFSGSVKKEDIVFSMATEKSWEVLQVGIFSPQEKKVDTLRAGEVGFIAANIKNTRDVKIGDTFTLQKKKASRPLPGFAIIHPVVFAGIYPMDTSDFEILKDSLVKLQLNDSALYFEQESSFALGFGFRCGFLGLLHLETTFERLHREFDLDLIITAPSVVYKFHLRNGDIKEIDNPVHYPDPSTIQTVEEPWVRSTLISPYTYMGALIHLINEKRGDLQKTESSAGNRVLLTCRLPMNEILTDFNDRLKSVTQGYASFDYEMEGYQTSDIIKLEIRVNEEPVDAFSCLIHRSKAESKGRALCAKLKQVIPRQLFRVAIQAVIGGKIIARETISALTKDVTDKCYGGDITRKRKLWEKQKKGKKKMREFGKVTIPQSAFIEVLKTD